MRRFPGDPSCRIASRAYAGNNTPPKQVTGSIPIPTTCVTPSVCAAEISVRENTIADVLWHEHAAVTHHYSVAQIEELVGAVDVIADDSGRANKSLQMLQLVP